MFTSDLHSPYFPIACNVKLSWKGSPARGYISQAPLHPDGAIWWVLSSGMWLELVRVTGPPHTHIHIGPTANCQHLHFFSGRLCPPGLALPTDTSRLEMPGNYHPLANSFKQMIDNMDVNPSSSSFKWEDSETCNLHWVPEFPQQDQPLVAHSGTLLDNILSLFSSLFHFLHCPTSIHTHVSESDSGQCKLRLYIFS